MPKFNCGDGGITIRLTLPQGETFPSGAAAQIVMRGQETGKEMTFSGTLSSNTTTLACVDYTVVSTDFTVPDAYQAQCVYTAPGNLNLSSESPHPVWNVEARL